MPSTIKELDGLPSGEIKLLVSEAEQRIMDAVDEKFAVQEGKLDVMQDNVSILVGNTKLEGLMQGTKKSIDALTVRHDTWHGEDLSYRSEMKSRMTVLEADTKQMGDQVSHVKWLVYASYGVGRVSVKCFDLLKSEAFWQVAGCGIALFLLEKDSSCHISLDRSDPANAQIERVMNELVYSKRGLALTESFEGLRLTAYRDVKGVLTIGYGHTGPDVSVGLTISAEDAERLLLRDVQHASDIVNRLVTLPALTQDEFDALVDFAFNAGCGALAGSTLLRDLNAGDLAGAAAQFEAWDHASGEVVAGLLRRRIAEEVLFKAAA